jgi:hypothetical protein
MAALNIANDLLSQTQITNETVANQEGEIQSLTGKLDKVISRLKTEPK